MGFKEIRTNLRGEKKLGVRNLVFLVVCKMVICIKMSWAYTVLDMFYLKLYMLMFVYTPSPQGNEGKLKTYYCRGLFLCNLSPSLFWKLFALCCICWEFGIAGCLKNTRQDFTLRYRFKAWSSRGGGESFPGNN